MPNRDWTWPQGRWSQTGKKMGKCVWSANIPFNQWQPTRGCGQHKWMGNRWIQQNQNLSSPQNPDEATKG